MDCWICNSLTDPIDENLMANPLNPLEGKFPLTDPFWFLDLLHIINSNLQSCKSWTLTFPSLNVSAEIITILSAKPSQSGTGTNIGAILIMIVYSLQR